MNFASQWFKWLDEPNREFFSEKFCLVEMKFSKNVDFNIPGEVLDPLSSADENTHKSANFGATDSSICMEVCINYPNKWYKINFVIR